MENRKKKKIGIVLISIGCVLFAMGCVATNYSYAAEAYFLLVPFLLYIGIIVCVSPKLLFQYLMLGMVAIFMFICYLLMDSVFCLIVTVLCTTSCVILTCCRKRFV